MPRELVLQYKLSDMPSLTKTAKIPFFSDNSIWSTFISTLRYCQNGFNKLVISLVMYIIPAWPNGYSGWLSTWTNAQSHWQDGVSSSPWENTCCRHCFYGKRLSPKLQKSPKLYFFENFKNNLARHGFGMYSIQLWCFIHLKWTVTEISPGQNYQGKGLSPEL